MNPKQILEEQLAEYLKKTPGTGRIMKQIQDKYRSFGRFSGVIPMVLTKEEGEFLNGILKKHYRQGDLVKLSVKSVVKAFQQTRFAEADFMKACELYFEEPLITKKEKRIDAMEQRQLFFAELLEECPRGKVREWLSKIVQGELQAGSDYVAGLYRKNPELFKGYIHQLADIHLLLEGGLKTSLPILAAEATKDPHALDKDRELYRLLVSLLSWEQEIPQPNNQFRMQTLLYGAGIQPDIGTRTIMTYGLVGIGPEGSRGWENFRENLEPLTLSLKNLERVTEIRPYREGNPVIAVENPAVFMYLIQMEKELTVICTSGQLHWLDHRVIEILLQNPRQVLIYSGDIDPEGLLIADKIWAGYPDQVKLVGYEKEVYHRSLADRTIGLKRLRQLEKLRNPILQELAREIQAIKKPGYQEYVIEALRRQIGNMR